MAWPDRNDGNCLDEVTGFFSKMGIRMSKRPESWVLVVVARMTFFCCVLGGMAGIDPPTVKASDRTAATGR